MSYIFIPILNGMMRPSSGEVKGDISSPSQVVKIVLSHGSIFWSITKNTTMPQQLKKVEIIADTSKPIFFS